MSQQKEFQNFGNFSHSFHTRFTSSTENYLHSERGISRFPIVSRFPQII